MVAITYPKALLLFAAFVPQFLVGSGTPVAGLFVAGLAYIAIEAVSALGYSLLGGRLHRLSFTRRMQRRLDAVSGTAFLGLAGYLAAEQRP